MRANARIWLGCAIAVMAGFSALPGQAAPYILLPCCSLSSAPRPCDVITAASGNWSSRRRQG
jgi:hypothetical protein